MKYIGAVLRRQAITGDLPPWLEVHTRRDYIIAAALSTPPWVNRRQLHDLMREAKRRSIATGIPHVVDHILPVTVTASSTGVTEN